MQGSNNNSEKKVQMEDACAGQICPLRRPPSKPTPDYWNDLKQRIDLNNQKQAANREQPINNQFKKRVKFGSDVQTTAKNPRYSSAQTKAIYQNIYSNVKPPNRLTSRPPSPQGQTTTDNRRVSFEDFCLAEKRNKYVNPDRLTMEEWSKIINNSYKTTSTGNQNKAKGYQKSNNTKMTRESEMGGIVNMGNETLDEFKKNVNNMKMAKNPASCYQNNVSGSNMKNQDNTKSKLNIPNKMQKGKMNRLHGPCQIRSEMGRIANPKRSATTMNNATKSNCNNNMNRKCIPAGNRGTSPANPVNQPNSQAYGLSNQGNPNAQACGLCNQVNPNGQVYGSCNHEQAYGLYTQENPNAQTCGSCNQGNPNAQTYGPYNQGNPNAQTYGPCNQGNPNAQTYGSCNQGNPNAQMYGSCNQGNTNAQAYGSCNQGNPNTQAHTSCNHRNSVGKNKKLSNRKTSIKNAPTNQMPGVNCPSHGGPGKCDAETCTEQQKRGQQKKNQTTECVPLHPFPRCLPISAPPPPSFKEQVKTLANCIRKRFIEEMKKVGTFTGDEEDELEAISKMKLDVVQPHFNDFMSLEDCDCSKLCPGVSCCEPLGFDDDDDDDDPCQGRNPCRSLERKQIAMDCLCYGGKDPCAEPTEEDIEYFGCGQGEAPEENPCGL